mgnify:CR=1 FL=1
MFARLLCLLSLSTGCVSSLVADVSKRMGRGQVHPGPKQEVRSGPVSWVLTPFRFCSMRFACEVEVTEDLDGMTVALPIYPPDPDSRE